jgi:polysaccharide biosynthesis/export protein
MKAHYFFRLFFSLVASVLYAFLGAVAANAQDRVFEDKLGPGDSIRIQVFQNPDLTLDARIMETGSVSYPLIGSVKLAGLTIPEAEETIGQALKSGGFLQHPQVTITLGQARRKQVSVLGAVGRAGPFPLETNNTYLSDILAVAGGISAVGSDIVIVTGQRDGKPLRREIDVNTIYLDGRIEDNIVLAGGDVVYVPRAPVFYVYGEAQRSGSFRLERNMTFIQALVTAGGPSARGTERKLRLIRVGADGKPKESVAGLFDLVQPNDIIYVRESLF